MEFIMNFFVAILCVTMLINNDKQKIKRANSPNVHSYTTTTEFIDEVISQKLNISNIPSRHPAVIIDGLRYYSEKPFKDYKKHSRYIEFTGYKYLYYRSGEKWISFRAEKSHGQYIVTGANTSYTPSTHFGNN